MKNPVFPVLLFLFATLLPPATASGVMAQSVSPPAGAAGEPAVSGAIEQKPLLTPAQRRAIYAEVANDKSKVSPKSFTPVAGADVPPMIELYALPDDTVAEVPAAKLYKYTLVANKVVLVDPTHMRVVDVIGPAP